MMTTVYEIEISKRDQQIAELLQRNKELEEENKRLKELLHNKGKSKEVTVPEGYTTMRVSVSMSISGNKDGADKSKRLAVIASVR